MNRKKLGVFLTLVVAIASTTISAPVQAQSERYSGSRERVQQFFDRFHDDAGTFRHDLDKALDHSRFNGSNREDNINQLAKDFDDAVGQLRRHFNKNESVASDVQTVLNQGSKLNNVMRRLHMGGKTRQDWAKVSSELDELARISSRLRRF